MRKILLLGAVAALTAASPALANPNDPGPLPGCAPSGNTPQKCDGDTNNGGDGGTGVGVGVAIQGQLQVQGQQQGQIATGGDATSVATGGSVTDSGNSISVNTNVNKASGGDGGDASANSSTSNSGNSSVTVEGDSYRDRRQYRHVSTAYAAPLTSGLDTCHGSRSGGAQTGLFGITLAGTKRDATCENIKLSRELKAQGFGFEACQLLVNEDRRVARAFASTGRTCTAVVPIDEVVQPVTPYVPPIPQPEPENG